MKYIFLEKKNEEGDTIFMHPIIFDNAMVHADIAEAICVYMKQKHNCDLLVASAGDINIGVSSTSGKSTTLELNSRVKDKDFINVIDYMPVREADYALSKKLHPMYMTPKDWYEFAKVIDNEYIGKDKIMSVERNKLGFYSIDSNETQCMLIRAFTNMEGYIYKVEVLGEHVETYTQVTNPTYERLKVFLNSLKEKK